MDLFNGVWYTSNIQAMRELVEDPTDTRPRPGEPILEVIVGRAQFRNVPTHQSELMANVQHVAFVRISIDNQVQGETSSILGDASTWQQLAWNERLLVCPRGASRLRFELCSGGRFPAVRCSCAIGVESIWRAAETFGHQQISGQLMRNGQEEVGTLFLYFQMWDGLPPDPRSGVRPCPQGSHEDVVRQVPLPEEHGPPQVWALSQQLPFPVPNSSVPLQPPGAGPQMQGPPPIYATQSPPSITTLPPPPSWPSMQPLVAQR